MKSLCSNVRDASERIRQEMEKLQRDEELVRKQEDRLLHTIEQLEQKENHFRDKGMRVIHEQYTLILTAQQSCPCSRKQSGSLTYATRNAN